MPLRRLVERLRPPLREEGGDRMSLEDGMDAGAGERAEAEEGEAGRSSTSPVL